MKNIIALCIFFGTTFMAFGQVAPSSINYQSILRNSNGSAVPNQNISVRFSVLQGSTLGTYVFQEEHTVTTTDIGLINLKIGQGLSPLNSLSTIDWSQGPYFIQVEVDTTSTGSYSSYGSSEISSVPYALYSSSSAVTDSLSPLALSNLPKLTLSNDSLFIGNLDTIVIPFSQFNLTEIQVDSMVSNNGYLLTEKDSSVVNEIQELQLSGDSLTLSIVGTGVDLTKYLDDTKWSENQIDSLVGNNGFLTFEQDSSVTNEIQVLSRTGYKLLLSLSNDSVDMSDLIQDIHLSNDSLTITNNVNSSVVDLSPYLDNTVLSETEVDSYVSNNGYLTTEVDGSVTNELQDIKQVLETGTNADENKLNNLSELTVGTNSINSSAIVEISSTTKGFLPPRMTESQRNSIQNPEAGLVIYCTDCGYSGGELQVYNGTRYKNLSAKNHYVGEFFQGGVIFHLWNDSTGEHGLIVSPIILDSAGQWSNMNIDASGAKSSWDGYSNTQAILNQNGHTNSFAKICSDYAGGGFTDWYLPSFTEANLLRDAQFAVNKALSLNSNYNELGGGDYGLREKIVTSTEIGDQKYIYIALGPSNTGSSYQPKSPNSNDYKVRAIRSF